MKDQTADKRSPIVAGALILTAVFLGVFGWLLISTTMPPECSSGLWLLDRLACLAPNELGDTFAGAFAPVAFVWLVAAVMLQRNELAAQRQELRESREVAEAQVVEARNNVAFMAEQTKMLQVRSDVEALEQKDEELRAYVDALNDLIETSFDKISVSRRVDDGYGNDQYSDIYGFAVDHNADPFKRLKNYAQMFSFCSIEAFRAVEQRETVYFARSEELSRIQAHLSTLSKKSSEVSDAIQIRCQIIDPDNASWRLGQLVKMLAEVGKKIPEMDY